MPRACRLGLAWLTCACLVAALAVPRPTSAADESAQGAAMSALKLARFHYDKGDFDKAAALFLEAYRIDPKPEFIFNAGRAEQRAMRLDDAERHFRQCLAHDNLEATVDRRVRIHLQEVLTVKKALASAQARGAAVEAPEPTTPTSAAAPPPAPPGLPPQGLRRPAPQRWKMPAGVTLSVVGLATAGLGGWMLNSWSGEQDDLDRRVAQVDSANKVVGIAHDAYAKEQRDLNGRLNLGVGLVSAGAVAFGAGMWMLWTAPGATSTALLPTGDGWTALLATRF